MSGKIRFSPAERFERFTIPEPNSGCIIWTGGGERYGNFYVNGKSKSAHVWADADWQREAERLLSGKEKP